MLALLVLASPAGAGATGTVAPKTWEAGEDGQWLPVDEPAASDGAIENPTLDEIEQFLAAGRHRAARKPIIRWIKANSDAPDRDRGLFLLAEMYDQAGDKIRAFYHLDELMDYYPSSRLFYPALEKQYAIAGRFVGGYRPRVLGLPLLTAKEQGVEMLFRIQERAPGSPIAERSLLRTADHYYDDSQFDLASDAYAAYVRSYPRSAETPRARLFRAYSSLAQFSGLQFDATPVIDAKAQLEDVRAEYPDLAEQENVADVLERIDGILAARVYQTADFYRRTNEPRAAVYNWRYVVENYPDTTEAARAQQQLARMPAWSLELPVPAQVSVEGDDAGDDEQLGAPLPGAPAPSDTAAPPAAADDPAGLPGT